MKSQNQSQTLSYLKSLALKLDEERLDTVPMHKQAVNSYEIGLHKSMAKNRGTFNSKEGDDVRVKRHKAEGIHPTDDDVARHEKETAERERIARAAAKERIAARVAKEKENDKKKEADRQAAKERNQNSHTKVNNEDAPVNNVGSGNIAGTTKDSLPGVDPKKKQVKKPVVRVPLNPDGGGEMRGSGIH